MSPEEILEKLHEKWREVEERAQRVLEQFNATLRRLARWVGWLADKIADLWNSKVVPAWSTAVQWVEDHWNQWGAPWLCFGAAGDWRSLVGSPVSARAGLATKGQLDVDTTWKGSAAQAYVDRLGQQESAISAVSEQFTEPIATALVRVGGAIIVWWLGIVLGLGTLVLALIGAGAEAISIVGIELVPPTLVAGWTAFFTGVVVGTATLLAAVLLAKSDMDGARTRLTKYPAGRWPAFG